MVAKKELPARNLLLAEAIGTFILVFAGTGAAVVNDVSGGVVSHVGVALTFGLVVFTMIYTIGDVSGAHINPAVTIGFWAAGRFPLGSVAPYVGAQLIGAFSGSLVLRALFPAQAMLGGTQPAGTIGQSFLLEVLLGAILMLVVLNVSHGAMEKGITAGLVIGGVVGWEVLFAGPISGASMNPARSLAPALVSGQLGGLWIYLTAPILGAILGVCACRGIRDKDCCGGCC